MDVWQKRTYDKLKKFVEDFSDTDGFDSASMKINRAEAYVLMKAMEYQELHANPPIVFDCSEGVTAGKPGEVIFK